MQAALKRAVGAALDSDVKSARPLGGGDINDAYAVTLTDGREVFVKTNAAAPHRMFETEAMGLGWLSKPAVIRVPEVLAFSNAESGAPPFLALELIQPGRRVADFDERLGRALARLHRSGAEGFGLDHDNFIGRLPQENAPSPTWVEFYGSHRLKAQLRMAINAGHATSGMRQGMDRVLNRLADLVGPDEPPSRLHGDLWGGNLHVDENGQPCLIDPAVYGGHREIDLAMMRLFGGFGARVFDAYNEQWPLAEGHQARIPLYQLYPLMVHVNLFGGGYVASVERTLGQLI